MRIRQSTPKLLVLRWWLHIIIYVDNPILSNKFQVSNISLIPGRYLVASENFGGAHAPRPALKGPFTMSIPWLLTVPVDISYIENVGN